MIPRQYTRICSFAFLLLSLSIGNAIAGCLVCVSEELDRPPWFKFHCVNVDDDGYLTCTVTLTSCSASGVCKKPKCFLAGTLVSTPSGDVPIESLREGDEVISVSPEGRRVVGRVTERLFHVANGYLVLNGATNVTGEHRFLRDDEPGSTWIVPASTPQWESHELGQWVPLQDIELGGKLVRLDGSLEEITSIERVERGARVYNLEVAPFRNYVANGFVVHNAKPDPNQ